MNTAQKYGPWTSVEVLLVMNTRIAKVWVNGKLRKKPGAAFSFADQRPRVPRCPASSAYVSPMTVRSHMVRA